MSADPLVAELARKSGLLWVRYDGADHPVWHAWVDDAVCVVAGGHEQPLPGIADQHEVTLLLRSKTTRHLVTTATARVEVLGPGDEAWPAVTEALRAGRLNLRDRAEAVDRWAHESVVVRLVPVPVEG